MQFHRATLDNGLEIIAEIKPEAQSAAVGFFVQTGARDETPDVAGVSHFLEHMAFKGDERFSAHDVNRIFDELGANCNAWTSEEMTVYYAAILPEHLQPTVELLAALMRPSLRQEDFDTEKGVILDEISKYEDIPAMSVYDQIMMRHFTGHPLGQSVLGSTQSITALTSQQMREYHERRYGAANLVLVAAGNVDWDELQKLAAKYCGHWSTGKPGRVRGEAAPLSSRLFTCRTEMHQEHVMQMGLAPAAQSELRFAADIASTIVGDDNAGRLYWDLVETGLAETCDVAYHDFDGTGAWLTYLCCAPETVESNLARIAEIYREFNVSGPTEAEFIQAKNKVASRVVLGSELPMGRLSSLGSTWVQQHQYRSVSDDLQTLKNLTMQDVRTLLAQYPLSVQTTVGLGPYASAN